MKRPKREPLWVIGWREWLSLPELGIPLIKAKIDTGARSSVLHALNVECFRRGGRRMVRFGVHPFQRNTGHVVAGEAEMIDERLVRSSAGHEQLRPVILTTVKLRERVWTIEVTLTGRSQMGFRMLLGRQALVGRFLIDSARSYMAGRPVLAARKAKRRIR